MYGALLKSFVTAMTKKSHNKKILFQFKKKTLTNLFKESVFFFFASKLTYLYVPKALGAIVRSKTNTIKYSSKGFTISMRIQCPRSLRQNIFVPWHSYFIITPIIFQATKKYTSKQSLTNLILNICQFPLVQDVILHGHELLLSPILIWALITSLHKNAQMLITYIIVQKM